MMQPLGDYRIFVGAFPQGELADQLQQLREELDPVTARITAPHVTLAGTYWRQGAATPANEAETIARLQAVQNKLGPLTLTLGGVTSFPPADRPVIYLQVAVTPSLLALRSQLLQVVGRDKHRHFTPHLTLAMRVKGPTAQERLAQLQQSEWHQQRWSVPITRLALMQRGPHDPAWREIAPFCLQSSGPLIHKR
ncbi:MAG: 2'-5' RNA ligase family protein [Caldilineaceae bacterium]|nr:2'-5' RNA ligase family protein [Caldilineaceae bacterium]